MNAHTRTDSRATKVLELSNSRFARVRTIPVSAVRLTGEFWQSRNRRNIEEALPSQYGLLESTGRLNNFRRVTGACQDAFAGMWFNDSDIYKWLEAASWALAQGTNATLETLVEQTIALVEAAQDDDGYLNTYYSVELKDKRWSELSNSHEMYCGGHLIQAAVAHHRATGSTRLLAIAQRFADLLCKLFGPTDQHRRDEVDGHEEIEMSLLELARETGEARYRDLAAFFIDTRGQGRLKNVWRQPSYFQDHVPFRKMETLDGHAVRALYMACGVADLYLETGEDVLLEKLEQQWTHMTSRRMYISGGLGARHEGESFGNDFELPNERAYTETCAAIGSMMWNYRMLSATGNARYADLMEWTLFNGLLPGWSLDGKRYFYVNPLADSGGHHRQDWYECACCPPNVARTLASLGAYAYGTSGDDSIWVHLYLDSTALIPLGDREIALTQRTLYPWEGMVEIEVNTEGSFTLQLRIPGWCKTGATISVNGQNLPKAAEAGKYLPVTRLWRDGDRIQISLPMPIRLWESHPRVLENNTRVALTRGPILYCVESTDHPNVELETLAIDPNSSLTQSFEPNLLGGVVVLKGTGATLGDENWDGNLYRPLDAAEAPAVKARSFTAIPYFAWQNRGASQMKVWLKRTDKN